MKKIKCPNCKKNDRLQILLMNRENNTHYYILRCFGCKWEQKFDFLWSGLEEELEVEESLKPVIEESYRGNVRGIWDV